MNPDGFKAELKYWNDTVLCAYTTKTPLQPRRLLKNFINRNEPKAVNKSQQKWDAAGEAETSHMAGCAEQLTGIINAALSNSAWWQQRPVEKNPKCLRRSSGARPVCRHWGRGAEPAPSSGLNHKHGWEASAGSVPKGNVSIFLI